MGVIQRALVKNVIWAVAHVTWAVEQNMVYMYTKSEKGKTDTYGHNSMCYSNRREKCICKYNSFVH